MTHLLALCLAAGLVSMAAGCGGKKQPKSRQAAVTKAGEPLKPVTIDPAPACDLPAESGSQPRGVLIALYHTANVVGEVEPCG